MINTIGANEEIKSLQVESLGEAISKAISAIAQMIQGRKKETLEEPREPFDITKIDMLADGYGADVPEGPYAEHRLDQGWVTRRNGVTVPMSSPDF